MLPYPCYMHSNFHTLIPALSLLAASFLPLAATAADAALPAAALRSGIDPSTFDRSVRAQDDFYAWINGNWARSTQIPASRSRWGTYDELREKAAEQVRAILDDVVREPGVAGSERR